MHLKHGNLNSEYSHHGSEWVKMLEIKSTNGFLSVYINLWSLQQFSFLYPKAGDPHNFAKNGHTVPKNVYLLLAKKPKNMDS